MAWSCYCVDCGASKCVRREEVTRTVFKKGSKHWRQGYKNGEYHVWAVETGEKSWFYDLCDRNGAQEGKIPPYYESNAGCEATSFYTQERASSFAVMDCDAEVSTTEEWEDRLQQQL
ncbi:hypothetical protein BX616_010274 [Lobosporangium transversale]|nr:hypothetical protein BX616_010274 [Lobosporangium transversale]